MKVNHVVLDTNVLISALLSYQGAARKTLDIVRNHGTLIFSEEPFTELLTRLYRLKFRPLRHRQSTQRILSEPDPYV